MPLPDQPIRPAKLHIPPNGSWPVPGSKSLTNRALVLAALAAGTSILEGALDSDDTARMGDGLRALGVPVERIDAQRLLVRGGRERLRQPEAPLFVGNSGTTVRFLSALASLVPGCTTLQGDAYMAERPIADLVQALRDLGLQVDCATGCPPLSVHGGRLPGGRVHMDGTRSSQYFSALLMAAGCAEAPIDIVIDGELVSRPYVRMTLRLIEAFGGIARETQTGFHVEPCRAYRSRSYRVEPDASAASYPLALAAAGGGALRIPALPGDSLQGDVAFLDLLERMGATAQRDSHGIGVHAARPLHGIEADMHHISDCVMSLAAIAPLCDGPTTITNIANIRIKETDRLAATVQELRRLGQVVTHGEDWLRIEPRPLTAATVDCYGDHRMAMSFGVLGMLSGQVTIADPACVAKTYPGFWDDAAAIYHAAGQEPGW